MTSLKLKFLFGILFRSYWTTALIFLHFLIIRDRNIPTNPFTILEPRDQIGEFYVAQERRATNFEASKL